MENTNTLILKNITHYYQSKNGEHIHAINDIDLSVKKGEFLAIVGSSGCGKSTLLNIMCGYVKTYKRRSLN